MANYLILDKDLKPLTVVQWDGKSALSLSDAGQHIVQFDAPFFPDGMYDAATNMISDPNAPPTTAPEEGEPVTVLE